MLMNSAVKTPNDIIPSAQLVDKLRSTMHFRTKQHLHHRTLTTNDAKYTTNEYTTFLPIHLCMMTSTTTSSSFIFLFLDLALDNVIYSSPFSRCIHFRFLLAFLEVFPHITAEQLEAVATTCRQLSICQFESERDKKDFHMVDPQKKPTMIRPPQDHTTTMDSTKHSSQLSRAY